MLTLQDKQGATAERLRRLLGARIEAVRTKLEGDHDDRTTTKLRGRLAELKELLALLQAAPADVPAPDFAAGLGAFGLDPQP